MGNQPEAHNGPARGVVLTGAALQSLEAALQRWWEQSPLEYRARHRKMAQEVVAEKLGLNLKTLRKLRARQATDRATLQTAFAALDLAWHDTCCMPAVLWHQAQTQERNSRTPGERLPARADPGVLPQIPAPWLAFPLVGREQEVTEVLQMLEVARLVTLCGIGGVGKSRVARAVESAWSVRCHPFSTCRVDMAGQSPSHTALVSLLQGQPAGRGNHAPLARHFADCSLVVLDNWDHASGDNVPSVLDLLKACPTLRVLITRRSALGVPGEAIRSIRPLAVPAPLQLPERPDPIRWLSAFPGVQVFLQTLTSVHPSFALTDTNVEQVATLCYGLDGVPRALEFAAVAMAAYLHGHREEQSAPEIVARAIESALSEIDTPHA